MPSAVTLYQLESHLWKAANAFRGLANAADFKFRVVPLLLHTGNRIKTGRAQNELLPEHVERIHGWVRNYTDVEGIARLVTLDEIAANDHNLNIPRYVDPKFACEGIAIKSGWKVQTSISLTTQLTVEDSFLRFAFIISFSMLSFK